MKILVREIKKEFYKNPEPNKWKNLIAYRVKGKYYK